MNFTSTEFIYIFFPIVLLLYFNPLAKNLQYKNIVLLMSSLIFYAWGEPIYILVFIIEIVFSWIIALRLDKLKKKFLLIFSIAVIVFPLFLFKYLPFWSRLIFNQYNNKSYLPIGISFFTFQIISYLVDVYKSKVNCQTNLIKYSLYVSLFPQLVAGPIVRYTDIEKELDNRSVSLQNIFNGGMERFMIGFVKKILLANYMSVVADNIFWLSQNTGEVSVLTSWLGAITYSLQIYFDFSGYSDMAIGLGGIFGFHIPENFNYPYIATSITDFWRRWHISLSTWFRDYVYIPMGGNRKSKICTLRNLALVWLLTGLWHGADVTFLIWGGGYFLLILLEKNIKNIRIPKLISWIYTMTCVVILWVVFRAENIYDAYSYILNLFGRSGMFYDSNFIECFHNVGILLPIALLGCTPWTKIMEIKHDCKQWKSILNGVQHVIIVILFIVSISVQSIKLIDNSFVYFNF